MASQVASAVRRSGAALAGAVVAWAMLGCGQVNNASSQIAALRIIDASIDAGGLDVYANTTPLTYNVGFGTVSSYIVFAPGTYTFSAHPAGSSTVATSIRGSLLQKVQYTLLVGNVAASLQSVLLQDQSVPAPSGQVALRFIDQASRTGAIDVYLVAQGGTLLTSIPVAKALAFNNGNAVPQYIDVPNGSYSLVVLPAGTVPTATTVPAYSGAVVTYPGGSARTVIVLDQQLTSVPGVQVVTASDYDSTTA